MSKTPHHLPSIDHELAPAPRQKLDLRSLKPRGPLADEAVEANSRAIGEKWGASTQLPQTEAPLATVPVRSIRGYIPEYLDDELALKAAERRVTKTFLIMEALAKFGYRVQEVDLVQDRRRSKQKGHM
jgi:hypothetical protein